MPDGTIMADFGPEATTTFSSNYMELEIAVE